MPSIFISYRRSDSQADAGRIYDRLAAHFGPRAVFKDVDDIPPGVDFRDYLNTTLNQCWVVVVVIGPGWLTATDSSGQRRLDNPADWVRVEVEEALRRNGVLVVPLLVGHATMPRPDQLPDSLQNLAYRNCGEARPDPDFHRDMSRLIARLEPYLHPASKPSPAALPLPWPAKPQPWNRDPLSLGLSRQRFLQWLGWAGLGLAGVWGTSRVVPQLLALKPTLSPPAADNPHADNTRNPDADNNWDTETTAAGTASDPDLQPLKDLLQTEQWEAADQETLAIFQAVLAADAAGWMDANGVVDFPCATLQRIDQLWSRASNGKFGFSTQRQIFIDACDGTSGDDIDQATFLCFLEQVGWRKVWETNDPLQVVYSLDAPAGHLPWKAICTGSDYCDASLNELQWYAALLRQLEQCG